MKLKQLLQFGIPNSALRIIIFTFLINGCFLTAKYNHPMDGIGGIILNAVLLNTTRNASLPQTVVLTGLPSVITEGQSASVDVKLALATTSAIQVTLTLDNPAITVDGLASKVLTFSPENATVNQTIKVAAVTDSNNVSELVNMKVTATGLADQTVSISAVDTNVAKPTITVSIGSTEYKNGDTFTFNVTKSNVDNSQNISIINNTNASLTLTGAIKVTIGGANSSNFSVIQPSVTTIIPSGSTNFTLVFNTSYTTDRIASITIQNDDLTNPNYTLNIIGKCNPESDSFVFTGDLINARYSHTASLLSNGKVLVTGGTNVGTLSSAELYDPATGSFTATGNMTVSRTDHTATRLNNGNILIVGGGSNTTELYDPNTGTFTATGNAGGSYSTATLLNNGNVLVAGNVTNTAKLYDPSTGLFTATTGNMVAARNFVPTILLGNGKVLFAGGYVPACPVSTAELYDPGTGTFSATGSIGTVWSHGKVTTLTNGKVIVAGGNNGCAIGGGMSNSSLYDFNTGLFTATGNLTSIRYLHTVSLLNNGKALIFGGKYTTSLSNAELYDPNTGTFASRTAIASVIRSSHTATVLNDGKVLIIGGQSSNGTTVSSVLYYP